MKPRASSGFLLVELLIAVAVLGTGLFAVFRAMSSALRTHQAAGDAFEASLALGEKTWEWRQTGTLPPEGSDGRKDGWIWAPKVESRNPLGQDLSLTVSWTAGGRKRSQEAHDHRL